MFEKLVTKLYKKSLLVRYDPDGSVFYYSPDDFDLYAEPFSFTGDRGQLLQGYFYEKDVKYKSKLIIFEHGMGCGHRAYMREIATIVNAGYRVFAYDHTGTLESEGEHIGGFSQSLADLDHAIRALKAGGHTVGTKISVIGHSWGAFSTMNIPAFHREISHVVAMSGYISVREMLGTVMKGMKGYIPTIFATEEESFGAYAYADARLSLRLAPTKAMIIHSKDDPTCPFYHFEKLRDSLKDRENTVFLELDGKRHNPNFTEDAVVYKDEFFADLTKRRKKKMLSTPERRHLFITSYDWERMTAQDDAVWKSIFDFLRS